jgi:flavin reductase (DIM6/NTAB) family NADH-FMN oxidoreductase RutF
MRFDIDKIDDQIAYKLLAATVVPRPIAWVTTLTSEGQRNAAPFSFFNVMGPSPATLVLGINADAKKGYKDTARNIFDTGEFVVNLVPFALADAMNITAVDAPTGTDELSLAGLETTESALIKPPRIAQSPVAFECVTHSHVETGPHQVIVIGKVVSIHVEDKYVRDAARGHIETEALDLIGRTFGSGYIRTHDRFDLVRPSWQTFKAKS